MSGYRKLSKFTVYKLLAIFFCAIIIILNLYVAIRSGSSHHGHGRVVDKDVKSIESNIQLRSRSKSKIKTETINVKFQENESELDTIQENIKFKGQAATAQHITYLPAVASVAIGLNLSKNASGIGGSNVKEQSISIDREEDNEPQQNPSTFITLAPRNTSKVNVNQSLVTQMVFLDIKIGEEEIGRIEIGLFGNIVPNTTANFKGLCEGFTDKASGKFVSLKGSKFHRVINKFMIQGGNIPGGNSIFGGHFPDENFILKFHGAGWVAMANAGKNTNKMQFFITTVDTTYLNGGYVVFGKVIKGMSVVYKIEKSKTGKNDVPVTPVVVVNSGVLPSKPFLTDEAEAVN